MKQYLSFIILLVMFASGCSQDVVVEKQPQHLNSRKFTASFENSDTRTYVANGKQHWNSGDQISLFDRNTLNSKYQFDGDTGDKSGTFSIVNKPFGTGDDLDCYYALYPHASNVEITEDGVITATLPAYQNYAENSFGLGANTMVAVTKDVNDTFLKFKNVGGYLKLQLYGKDIVVKSITLNGNNNEKLAGLATITPIYGQDPVVTMSNYATTSITLDCGTGVNIGSTEETATAFWIVVPPITFENGFKITITDVNGKIFCKSTSNKISIERNIIKPMTAFEAGKIPNNQIWYTSADGEIIEPYYINLDEYSVPLATFGVNVVSNTYENGLGIITFDDDVTTIGSLAFQLCSNLTGITIPDCVTEIGYNAFAGCSLTSITIPDSVTTIGWGAFAVCNFTSVTIPDSVTRIEVAAFAGCSNLQEFKGKFASKDNRCLIVGGVLNSFAPEGLTKYTIPEGVTVIGDYVFEYCSNLTNVTIPNSVRTIGFLAFGECYNLSSINIANSVTTIEGLAFKCCSSLRSVTLPNSVTRIGSGAFEDCIRLNSVYCKATIPPSFGGGGVFEYFDYDTDSFYDIGCTIYVPTESVEAYTESWYEYKDYIVGYIF